MRITITDNVTDETITADLDGIETAMREWWPDFEYQDDITDLANAIRSGEGIEEVAERFEWTVTIHDDATAPRDTRRVVDLARTTTPLEDFVGMTAEVQTSDGVARGVLEKHPYETTTMAVRLPDGRWAGTGTSFTLVVPDAEAIVETMVERAKREIVEDIRSGRVPADITSFQDLHDHVDANMYGGAGEDGPGAPLAPLGGDADAELAVQNAVDAALDAWIRDGGHRADR